MKVELNVTTDFLIELNEFRGTPAIDKIFEAIKTNLQKEENEICEMQELIYELENNTSDGSEVLTEE